MSEQKEPALTPEEIKARKEEMLKYFDEQIPFLEKQKAYQSLVTELEELRMRQVYAQVKIANLVSEPEEEPKETGRKLRKVE